VAAISKSSALSGEDALLSIVQLPPLCRRQVGYEAIIPNRLSLLPTRLVHSRSAHRFGSCYKPIDIHLSKVKKVSIGY
jgi:hypothetical protein